MMHGGTATVAASRLRSAESSSSDEAKTGICILRGFGGAGRVRLDGCDKRDAQPGRSSSR
jgi:hypothetical protein